MNFVQFILTQWSWYLGKKHIYNSHFCYILGTDKRQAISILEEMRIKNLNFEKEVIWDKLFE